MIVKECVVLRKHIGGEMPAYWPACWPDRWRRSRLYVNVCVFWVANIALLRIIKLLFEVTIHVFRNDICLYIVWCIYWFVLCEDFVARRMEYFAAACIWRPLTLSWRNRATPRRSWFYIAVCCVRRSDRNYVWSLHIMLAVRVSTERIVHNIAASA